MRSFCTLRPETGCSNLYEMEPPVMLLFSILLALARHPVAVPFHSIIATGRAADFRKGGDGIVPYWSAHLKGAASETILPYTHRSIEKPKTVQAVMKILKEAK